MSDNSYGLTILGSKTLEPRDQVECFPNDHFLPYQISLTSNEFTCKCPVTGQPDFASIGIEYFPNKSVVESKSLKLFLWSYRDVGIFHENVVNQIADILYDQIEPHWIRVIGVFNPRGGIGITVTAERGEIPVN